MISSAKPFFREKDIDFITKQIREVLRGGRLIDGPKLREFEEKFSEFIGTKYAVGVNSCTTALEISLRYLNLNGGEVIVPSYTFIASANTIIYSVGKPIFTEVEKDTLNLDPDEIRKNISSKTKAVIIVYIAGYITPRIDEILKICEEHNLTLIEDCAHALGSSFKGRKAGSFGVSGCFSFWPTKIMTTGTGGVITTNDENFMNYAKSLRFHGIGKNLQDIVNYGNDWLMNEIIACVGLGQMKVFKESINRRKRLVNYYKEELKDVKGIELFNSHPDVDSAQYKFLIFLNKKYDAIKINKILREEYNIQSEFLYYPPVHLMQIYKRVGYKEGLLPRTEWFSKSHICLPLHPFLTKRDVKKVVKVFKKVLDMFW